MYKDLPQNYVNELLDELLWPNHPLGSSIIGTVESLRSIDRGKLSSFKEKYYVPANIVVSAAGLLEHDKFVKFVKDIFTSAKKQEESAYSKVKEGQSAPALKILEKQTEQTHMALGFHAFKRGHPLRHAMGIMNIVLGANMSSRLFNELREKRGLAYEIGTSVKRYQDTGALVVHAGIDNTKVEQAIRLVLKELKKIKEEKVTDGEFKRAREFYQGQLMLALEDSLDHMLWIGESISTQDKTYTLEQIIEEVNEIGKEDVREAARRIFDEKRLNLALIGPLKGRERNISRELKID